MLIGVVSDTHNNLKNIDHIITLFNEEEVDLVIHTGDITNKNSLKRFNQLQCELIGVYGNNDKEELGLEEVAKRNNFKFQDPPFFLKLNGREIIIFHEPDSVDEFIGKNPGLNLIIHGHTHRFRHETKNGVVIFNPGESAGMLKGKNAIGLIDLNNLAIKRIFF